MTNNQEIATSIIAQMGGFGRLHAMVGAGNFISVDNGVMFTFKGSKKANKVVITLTPLDLYDIKYYKINMKNIDKSMIPVETSEGIYSDMLIEDFEKTTELYLHF